MKRIKIAQFLRTKNFYSISLFFGILLLTTSTIKVVRAKIEFEAHTPSPKNASLIFDIDGVLVRFPNGSVREALLKHKRALAKAAINPVLWVQIFQLLRNKAAAGQYQVLFKEKNPELAALVDEIAHSKKPIESMATLVQELVTAGYTLHIASNMGQEDFNYFKKEYPEIFAHFKTAKVIEYSANPAIKPVKKPNLIYFFQLLDTLKDRGERKATLIFIDDNEKNVQAAIEATQGTSDNTNLHGIVYKDSDQLRQELCKLGILAARAQ